MAASKGEPAPVASPSSKRSVSFPKMKITRDDVCFRILPAMGGISYEYFSLHIMNHVWFSRAFHHNDVVIANSFWFNAHIGVGLFLYNSAHLRPAPINRRILYSVFGSFLFNFGSVLFWATCKALLPEKPGLRAMFGLVSGFVLLYVGKEYVDYVDRNTKAISA